MNSNFNQFDFDLGIGSSNRSSKSLNDQKNKSSNSYSYSFPSPTSSFSQPGKPSWTHQPAPSQSGVTRTELGGPASMVGDITGKSWNSSAAPQKVAVANSIGIVNKNPNLFGDLVSSAIGQNKGSSNVPLKSAAPVKNSFSMGGLSNSLPKTSNASGYGNVASSSVSGGMNSNKDPFGSGLGGPTFSSGGGMNLNKDPFSSGLGGPTLSSGGVGGGMNSSKDPFGSLMNSSSKPIGSGVGAGIGSVGKATHKPTNNFDFGGFQKASNPNPLGSFTTQNQTAPLGSVGAGGTGIGSIGKAAPMPTDNFDFGGFQKASNSNPSTFSSGNGNPLGSFETQNQTAPLYSSGSGGQKFSGGDDWEFDSGFGGGHDDGGTTELDGLPPPPAGISASTAKTKGLDNYKQGQYADAIKWLSWAEVLLVKAGEAGGTTEVLSCRASCYKEVGEYKKAVADCTKVLDHDGQNVAVLVQRALLYESMEKYRLGAEDLRTVMKIDPGNRVARSTIHRLNKMADQ